MRRLCVLTTDVTVASERHDENQLDARYKETPTDRHPSGDRQYQTSHRGVTASYTLHVCDETSQSATGVTGTRLGERRCRYRTSRPVAVHACASGCTFVGFSRTASPATVIQRPPSPPRCHTRSLARALADADVREGRRRRVHPRARPERTRPSSSPTERGSGGRRQPPRRPRRSLASTAVTDGGGCHLYPRTSGGPVCL